jgi:hypothetical protein
MAVATMQPLNNLQHLIHELVYIRNKRSAKKIDNAVTKHVLLISAPLAIAATSTPACQDLQSTLVN